MKKPLVLLVIIAFLGIFQTSFAQKSTAKQSLFFELGKSELSDLHKAQLDSVIFFIQNTISYKIGIKGYTCNLGTPESNRKLSNQRALNVYNYLTMNGIKKDSVVYSGLALQDPLGDNSNEEGRRKNRRTDLEITFIYKQNPAAEKKETVAPPPPVEVAKFGPDATNVNFKKENRVIIEGTNCIKIDIPDTAFRTPGQELLEVNLKDLTKNYDIIKKAVHTFSGKNNLAMLGAFQIDVTQGTENVPIREDKPLTISIPGEFDEQIKLYRNSRNWELDTVNTVTYNYETKAYDVKLSVINEMYCLAKKLDSATMVLIKIKAKDKTRIKPYIIHSNCLISAGKFVKKKFYSLPFEGKTGLLRGGYQDFSSSSPKSYTLKEDISLTGNNLSPKTFFDTKFMKLGNPSSVEYKAAEMEKGNLCETPCK